MASGVVFVCSSMFQAIGNTWPSLMASGVRLTLVALPAFLLVPVPGFRLRWIWLLAVGAMWLQMGLCLLLLRREFAARLAFATPASPSLEPGVAVAPADV